MSETAEPEVDRELFPAVVLRPAAGYARGDTLSVELVTYHPETLRHTSVGVYQGQVKTGNVPVLELGPREGGTVYAVVDDRLNVRECGSTQCPIVGSANAGEELQVGAYQDGWYPLIGPTGDPSGYVSAEYTVLPPAFELLQFSEGHIRLEAGYRLLRSRLADAGRPDVLDGSSFFSRPVRGWVWRITSGASSQYEFELLCDASAELVAYLEGVIEGLPSDLRPRFDYSAVVYPPFGPPVEVVSLEPNGSITCRSLGMPLAR